ncbi:MAG: septum formation initiator family protein, partial [Candidatus Methylomirabilales bacterium]
GVPSSGPPSGGRRAMATKARARRIQYELPFDRGVRGRKRRVSQELRPMLLAGGVLLLALLFYVWQHIQVVRLSYEIEGLREARVTLVQEGKALKVKLSRLRSLKRVEKLARRKLGMVNPAPGQVIFLRDPSGRQ